MNTDTLTRSVVEALAGQGVCISSGSACHRGKPSHVFAALRLEGDAVWT